MRNLYKDVDGRLGRGPGDAASPVAGPETAAGDESDWGARCDRPLLANRYVRAAGSGWGGKRELFGSGGAFGGALDAGEGGRARRKALGADRAAA
jgi:hypothetical protein